MALGEEAKSKVFKGVNYQFDLVLKACNILSILIGTDNKYVVHGVKIESFCVR